MLEDTGESEQPIPLPSNASSVMRKYLVLEFCEYLKGEPLPIENDMEEHACKRTADISKWDQIYILVDQEMLFQIILAANYLDSKQLLDAARFSNFAMKDHLVYRNAGCKTDANMVKDKTLGEIRKRVNIANDFAPEEEVQVKKDNGSAEDP